MASSLKSLWIFTLIRGLIVCYLTAAAATDSDERSAARALPDNPLQYITTEPEVVICVGENVALLFNVTVPADLTADSLYERTVWCPHKKNHCFMHGDTSTCHGEDFVQRAEISETWFPVMLGELAKHGELKFQLNNVSLGDAGYYEGELKTGYNINNVNVMLTVKEKSSAFCQKPEGGDTGMKTDSRTEWRKGFDVGLALGIGASLGLVFIVGLAVIAIWQYRTKDEKTSDVPV
ncbi:uncharacterized protein LOC144912318 isoform X2 [Branchiostoma floridae x Branchiostoma belcheri]